MSTLISADSSELKDTPRAILSDLSVVIPTLGRPILETCIQHILAGTAWPARIIVIDQGSSATVADMLAQLRAVGIGIDIEHVVSPQRGRASGVNRGIERVSTRFVAVTDDDCFADANWLQNLAKYLRAQPESIVTGRVEQAGDQDVVALRTSHTPRVDRRPLLKHDQTVCGGNMAVALKVIQRTGLFDEDPCLRTAEDCEWSYRALRAAVPVIYAPDAVVHHYGWRDEDGRAAQYQSYARSHGGFLGKYLRRGDWFIALRVVILLLRALRRWLYGIVTGNRDLALNGRAYVTGLLPGIIAGWRSRRVV